jgi:hypothetical protein
MPDAKSGSVAGSDVPDRNSACRKRRSFGSGGSITDKSERKLEGAIRSLSSFSAFLHRNDPPQA